MEIYPEMIQTLISFFIFLLFGGICSYVAKQKGRDPVAWYILGMLFCLLSLIVLLLLPPLKPFKVNEEVEENEDHKLSGIKFEIQSETSFQQNEWFYIGEDKQPKGPVAFNFLKSLWKEGQIGSSSFVWTEGMLQWKRIKELSGLEDALLPSQFLDYSAIEGSLK